MAETQQLAINALENGHVIYFPRLPFILNEQEQSFLSPDKVAPKSKNISYDLRTDLLGGTSCHGEEANQLQEMSNAMPCKAANSWTCFFQDTSLLFSKHVQAFAR